jgi:hypothetical protein
MLAILGASATLGGFCLVLLTVGTLGSWMSQMLFVMVSFMFFGATIAMGSAAGWLIAHAAHVPTIGTIPISADVLYGVSAVTFFVTLFVIVAFLIVTAMAVYSDIGKDGGEATAEVAAASTPDA